ncbi:MAG: hypothetical protein CM1200mP38_1460 [Dehalococcoidia bacterium]|nr:MAG: hypothetical protein CM1200mP38_1460 [Dehalococcoidia bacterium]
MLFQYLFLVAFALYSLTPTISEFPIEFTISTSVGPSIYSIEFDPILNGHQGLGKIF